MAETMTPLHVGRIVFLGEHWLVQTLRNHTQNVALLAQAWHAGRAFQGSTPDLARTRAQMVEAARVHDAGKPARFQLQCQRGRGQAWEWVCSFRGHRFDAFHDDAYVQALAQLHHEYSVEGITEQMATLALGDATRSIAENLALDLYALEMCDQIEATVARAELGSSDPEERVFMDFQIWRRCESEYEVEPFPFRSAPLRFAVEYGQVAPGRDERDAVEKASDDRKRQSALRELTRWLNAQLQAVPLQRKEVSLWPWTV